VKRVTITFDAPDEEVDDEVIGELRDNIAQDFKTVRLDVLVVSMNEAKPWCTCGAKTPQGRFHKPGCPARERADA
jgi:hypothetical protein